MDVYRDLALKVAWSYLGKFYTWGGDDPSGFDCSGLVIECLKTVGAFPRKGDATADMLRKRYPQVDQTNVLPGDLVFWMRAMRAVHVAMVIDPIDLYIGAEGGGSRTKTVEDAIRSNAFIKVRPIASRGSAGDRVFATPF